jgi:hypothetical protein
MMTDLGPTTEQIESMRQNVMTRVAERSASHGRKRQPRRARGHRVGLIAIGAGTIAAALIVTGVIMPGGTGGATAEAAEFLDTAAAATIQTSDPVVGPGQYLRISTNAVYGAYAGSNASGQPLAWLNPTTGVLYIPADRSAEWVWERHDLRPTTFFGNSKAFALKMFEQTKDDPDLNGILRAKGGAFYNSPPQDYKMDKMPRDPGALRDYFYNTYAGGSASIDEDVWVRITDILRTGEVPADLRAALYKAMALVPGVAIIESEATLDGRKGVALGRTEPARGSISREEVIIDPSTGLVIGERSVALVTQGDIPAGTTTGWTSVATSVVDVAP